MKILLSVMLLISVAIVSAQATVDRDFEPVAINPASHPGDLDVHYVQGGPRMARIHDTLLALGPTGAHDHIYGSTNNGANWTQLENNQLNAYPSCLIAGSNETIFHFFQIWDHPLTGGRVLSAPKNLRIVPTANR